jgi:hypothetical protein
VLVVLEYGCAVTGCKIPEADGFVGTAANEAIAIGAKEQR